MTTNYNASQVGVEYVRFPRIFITYPAGALPYVRIDRELAVLLTDGTVRVTGELESVTADIDLPTNGDAPVPLVNPSTGEALGADTSLNQTFLAVLAVARQLTQGA